MSHIDSEFDIPLTTEEKERKIGFLKKRKFDEFKIHPYFYFSGYARHGVEPEVAEKIFYQFDKIISVFKRPARKGFK